MPKAMIRHIPPTYTQVPIVPKAIEEQKHRQHTQILNAKGNGKTETPPTHTYT